MKKMLPHSGGGAYPRGRETTRLGDEEDAAAQWSRSLSSRKGDD
jgi:hypothetical protein